MLQDFTTIETLVKANNRSASISNELVISIIWKESGFDDASKNAQSTATGFMQMTHPAVDDVNANTPVGIHYEYPDMLDGAKNIQCGTYYLDMMVKRAGGDLTAGLNHYGTGPGYADNLLTAAAALQAAKDPQGNIDPAQAKACLAQIHT
jgi:soluble lytic murein transglycosylase-like protein